MKPVLVTGSAGFIGYRFLDLCSKMNIPVVSVDAREHFAARPEHRGSQTGEIVDRNELFDWLATKPRRLSGIVHLGACTDTTETDEALFARENVEYSKRLWTYATEQRLPLVYASSAATYGDGAHGYDDDEALIPQLVPLNAYGRSKQAFDLWVLQQKTTPPAWSGWKFFNVYGYGERHKGHMASVILHAFDQRSAGGAVRLFRSHRPDIANGQQARDFISVVDVASVLMFALTKPVTRGIRNLGTGAARTYFDLARFVCMALGVHERIEFIDTPIQIRDKYQYFTQARVERLRETGYEEPFTTLEAGIAKYACALFDVPVGDGLSV